MLELYASFILRAFLCRAQEPKLQKGSHLQTKVTKSLTKSLTKLNK